MVKDILKIVKEFVSNNGFDPSNVIDFFQDGSAATYSFDTGLLEINQSIFYKEAKKYNVPVEDIVFIIVSHELGHANDVDLKKLHDEKVNAYELLSKKGYDEEIISLGVRAVVQAEQNAWNIGGKFIPSSLKEKYYQISRDNIEAHERKIKEDLTDFAKQVEKVKEWL